MKQEVWHIGMSSLLYYYNWTWDHFEKSQDNVTWHDMTCIKWNVIEMTGRVKLSYLLKRYILVIIPTFNDDGSLGTAYWFLLNNHFEVLLIHGVPFSFWNLGCLMSRSNVILTCFCIILIYLSFLLERKRRK